MSSQRWGSKLGVVMAVAGSAVGLGNFLRFPGQVAANGGGAYMIPYLVALLLLGLPLMWIEWTIGRFGGGFGHSTAPGMFHTMWNKNRFIKYFGVIGIFGPVVIFIYYTYVESWLIGYSIFSLTGKYAGCTDKTIGGFLTNYIGASKGEYFASILPAYCFFLITFAANTAVLWHGIRGGIERLCNIAMPVLLILGIIMMIRVFTLGAPDPAHPENNVVNGLGFMWNPNWAGLKDPKVWLAAAGQIFFTLSVGIGVVLTYASYLRRSDDVALSGLTAASTNEVAEVILGGSIVVPAAFAFLGAEATKAFVGQGESTFSLGFFAMPLILNKMPLGELFGFVWFILLFLAGITSSVSLAQPAIAFLEDEFNLSRKEAVTGFAIVTFILCHVAILGVSGGGPTAVDELDFWAVNVCLVVFALIEVILFAWVFGMERAWTELHHGSDITISPVYRIIIKFVTPLFLAAILGWWFVTKGYQQILFIDPASKLPWYESIGQTADPVRVMVRIILVLLFAALCFMVWAAWRRRPAGATAPEEARQ